MERNNQLLKKLDCWVGIPLLYCLSLFKRKAQTNPDIAGTVSTIGIFAFAAIGDSILSSSLFSVLKNQYPQAKIIIFASTANAAIYPILTGYDELVILPLTKPIKTLQILRNYSLDILIDTSQWTKLSALYSLLINARFKVGFKTPGQFRHYAYDVLVDHSDRVHESENFSNLLKPLGDFTKGSPSFNLEKIASQDLNFAGFDAKTPYIVFHPWASGTRSELRQWPLSSWVALGHNVLSQNLNIVITGSPENAADSLQLASLIGHHKRVFVAAGKSSLLETSKIITGAKAVVSVNTGIAHLADHLAVPIIVLNGPTNSKRWGVINVHSFNIDVLQASGGGFLNLGFEYPKNPEPIMDQISVEMVKAKLAQLIA